jgi:hypothetical protein
MDQSMTDCLSYIHTLGLFIYDPTKYYHNTTQIWYNALMDCEIIRKSRKHGLPTTRSFS